ncbi:MAG: SH3 domain-containing protein, partial [Chloroflexota bacterium]
LGNTQPAPFPEPSSAIATEGRWLAEFYNNTTLTPPVAFANETPSPVADWGTDAPVSEVNAEGWSARFTTSFFLNEGRYRATLRADDGVRFYVNGRLLIDQFGSTGGRAFDVEFDVGSGDQTFIIEHVEYGGTAFLRYSLARVLGTTETFVGNAGTLPQFVPTPISLTGTTSSIAPAPTSVPQVTTTDVTATVTARYINVRAEPRVARGNIVSTASSGQTFPVIGRANNGWVQLQVNGVTGWVNGRYVSAPNLLSVPITGQGPTS